MNALVKSALRWFTLVFLFCLFVACSSSNTTKPDSFFEDKETFGATIPEGAEILSPEAFKTLAQADDFVWDSLALRTQYRAGAEKLVAEDTTSLETLAKQYPAYEKVLLDPDSDVTVLADGNYQLTIEGKSGPFTVITDGKPSLYHDLLASKAQFEKPANQLKVYRYSYDVLPTDLKTGLPSPETLANASFETVLEARRQLAEVLKAHPDLFTDTRTLLPAGLAGLAISADAKPTGYPVSPEQELGAGEGSDHGGGCAFDSFHKDGLYQNFWWRQKYYQTSVKSQGNRGTCVDFALSSALESRIAIEQSRWVNVSEQYLWAKIAAEWDPRWYGDGTILSNRAEDFHEQGFELPLEQVWNYNPAQHRLEFEETEQYANSCTNYDEFCSNASHQRKQVCTTIGTKTYCGYQSQGATGERFKESEPDTIFDWYNDVLGLPVEEMQLLLKQGHPMVAGLIVNSGFKNLSDEGFVKTLSDAGFKGRHAVQIVGFISATAVLNHPNLPKRIQDYAALSEGGFFIIKNSWGYCYGDAGYVYVPLSWAKEFFTSVTVFAVKPSAEFQSTPNEAPSIEITAPEADSSFPYAQEVTYTATVTDDTTEIPSVSWTSDIDGTLGSGSQITAHFSSPGKRIITATATDNKGATSSASITVTGINQNPSADIIEPLASDTIYAGSTHVFFKGKGLDGDGVFPSELACSSLSWKSSNANDTLGTGCGFDTVFQSNGQRTISLTATDAHGAKGTDSVTINVQALPPSGPPVVTMTTPAADTQFDAGAKVRLAYLFSDPGATPTSTYTVVWSIKTLPSGTAQIITPQTCQSLRGSYACFIPSDYGYGNNGVKFVELKLSITDPEALTGTDSVQIGIGLVP